MKKSPICFLNIAAWILLAWTAMPAQSLAGYRYTTLDDPLAPDETFATGISGGNIVGFYEIGAGAQAFLYNGRTYTTLPAPPGATFTFASGISGSNIVGYYGNDQTGAQGFLYNSGTYTTLDDPLGVGGTSLSGISGSNIIGNYVNGSLDDESFILSGTTYATLGNPWGQGADTQATGISGSNIVGWYVHEGTAAYGYLLSGTTYTTLDDPFGVANTYANGISGTNIVGNFYDADNVSHGFLYSGTTYTTLDAPLACQGTDILGVSGSSIVGFYLDAHGNAHGFLGTPGPVIDGVEAGRYTLLLSATESSPAIPPGAGYGTMVVGPKGGVILAGRLPDGKGFRASGTLVSGSAGAQLTLYVTLDYRSLARARERGLLIGTLTFSKTQASDFTGVLQWIKPRQTRGMYRPLIDTNLSVVGSVYTPSIPGGRSFLPGFIGGALELSDTGTLALSGTAALLKDVSLDSTIDPQLVVTNPGKDHLNINVNPSTGVFTGTFLYPARTPVLTEFSGVLFQDQLAGGGFFLGPAGSGTVTLSR